MSGVFDRSKLFLGDLSRMVSSPITTRSLHSPHVASPRRASPPFSALSVDESDDDMVLVGSERAKSRKLGETETRTKTRKLRGSGAAHATTTSSSNWTDPISENHLDKFARVDYFRLARNMRSSIPVREHVTSSFRTCAKTFLGNDAVRYLLENAIAASMPEAVYVLSELMEQGHIYDVQDEDELTFKTGYRLFRFSVDDREIREVGDTDVLEHIFGAMKAGLKLRDRRLGFTTHKQVFYGLEAVNFVCKYDERFGNRADAVKLCEKLIAQGLILRIGVGVEQTFLDGMTLYRFGADAAPVEASSPASLSSGCDTPRGDREMHEAGEPRLSDGISPRDPAIRRPSDNGSTRTVEGFRRAPSVRALV